MTSHTHPCLLKYNSVSLECGHSLPALKFCKSDLNCSSCGTPLTTSKIWKKTLQTLQAVLKLEMQTLIAGHITHERLVKTGQPPSQLITDEFVQGAVNDVIDRVKNYMDFFPFKNVPGLEPLANHPINPESRSNYGYTYPAIGTRQAIEEFITRNGFQKEEMTIVDYGTGTGLMSYFFDRNGFKTLAIDCKQTRPLFVPYTESFLLPIGKEIHYVEQDECGLPEDCSKHILFLCWPEIPSHGDVRMFAGRVLREFRERNGLLAVYVGKGRGENTAGPPFFDEMEANWETEIVDQSKKATFDASDMYLLKRLPDRSSAPFQKFLG